VPEQKEQALPQRVLPACLQSQPTSWQELLFWLPVLLLPF
jgi:hypothetical protein